MSETSISPAIDQVKMTEETDIFIKGKFKAATQNLFGIFAIQYSEKGYINASHIVITSFSDIYGISVDDPWFKFEETITQYKWKGTYNTSLTNSLHAQLEKLRQDTSYNEQLFGFAKDNDLSGTNISIYDLINRILHDKQLILDCRIQLVTKSEIIEHKTKVKTEQKPDSLQSTKPSFDYGKDARIFSAGLILSPVKGKPLYDLRIGDKIMIKPDPSNQTALEFIDANRLRIDNRIKPVPAEIVDIKAESKTSPVEIIARISRVYYAKCFEEERQVKLRLYDPRMDGIYNFDNEISSAQSRKDVQPGKTQASQGFSPTTVALFAVGFFILIILMLLLYLMI